MKVSCHCPPRPDSSRRHAGAGCPAHRCYRSDGPACLSKIAWPGGTYDCWRADNGIRGCRARCTRGAIGPLPRPDRPNRRRPHLERSCGSNALHGRWRETVTTLPMAGTIPCIAASAAFIDQHPVRQSGRRREWRGPFYYYTVPPSRIFYRLSEHAPNWPNGENIVEIAASRMARRDL